MSSLKSMGMTLYHGPNGGDKQNKLFELISKSEESFLVLTQTQRAKTHLNLALIQKLNEPTFKNEPVQTFSDFLFSMVKSYTHRAHKAPLFLSQYLLYKLIQKHKPDYFLTDPSHFSLIEDMRLLFIELKKVYGLVPLSQTLSASLSEPFFLEVYHEYNYILKSLHYFDEGDVLSLANLMLKEKKTEWSFPYKNVFLYNIYPLGSSERAWLRQASQHFLNVNWHVFYDEDHTGPSDLLGLALEDLGQMATQTHFFDDPITQNTVYEYKSTSEEVLAVCEMICDSLLKSNAESPISVVAKASTAKALERLLKQNQVLCFNHYSQKISGVFSVENLEAFKAQSLSEKTHLDYAKASFKKLEADFSFAQSCMSPFFSNSSPESDWLFFEDQKKNLTFNPPIRHTPVEILRLDQLTLIHPKNIIVMDVSLETFFSETEPKILKPKAYAKKEWAEPSVLYSYGFRIQIEKFKAFLSIYSPILLTRSKTDNSHAALTRLPFKNLTYLKAQKSASPSHLRTQVFGNKKLSSMSVSDLQSYLNCPLKYYAQSVLKLKPKPLKELEPTPADWGSLLHQTMDSLLKNHAQTLELFFNNALLPEVLEELIQNTLKLFAKPLLEQSETSPEFFKVLLKKTEQAVLNALSIEKDYLSKNKKLTHPTYSEWPFKLNLGDIEITGRIDRIDFSPDKSYFSVLDYKLNATPAWSEVKQLKQIPLLIYALAAGEAFKSSQLSALHFYSFKEEKLKSFTRTDSPEVKLAHAKSRLSEEGFIKLTEELKNLILEIIHKIDRAEFNPNPQNENQCTLCDFKPLCPKFET